VLKNDRTFHGLTKKALVLLHFNWCHIALNDRIISISSAPMLEGAVDDGLVKIKARSAHRAFFSTSSDEFQENNANRRPMKANKASPIEVIGLLSFADIAVPYN